MITNARGRREERWAHRGEGGGTRAKGGGSDGYFGLLTTHCHSLKSRYHLAAIESRVRRPSL